MIDLRRFSDPGRVVEECALQILQWLGQAMDLNGDLNGTGEGQAGGLASLAISGGSSPRAMFEMFASMPFAWQRVHLFWVDERGVPPTDSQSNFKMANQVWLSKANFPAANIHRVQAELPPLDAAAKYVQEIREFFGLLPGQLPKFDVIHRGMGPDAHTASLFPGDPAIDDRNEIAAAVWVEKMNQWRITLMPGVLQNARHTAMLVVGADKAEAFQQVVNGPYDPLHFPAQIGARDGSAAVWFVDSAAAGPKASR